MNIGQASKAAGVSQRMVRHYEAVGLIPAPRRRDSGYRSYSDQDVERLRFIAHARDLGFSLPEISRLLALWTDRKRASAEVKALALEHVEQLRTKERQLAAMRRTLEQLAGGCHGDEGPDCPILEAIAGSGQQDVGNPVSAAD